MLTYFQDPVYELACSGGSLYAYVAYLAYMYGCSVYMIYPSALLSLTSLWFHCTKSISSFWADQFVLNSWVLIFLYEAYVRHWIAVGIVMIGITYAFLIFYIGQAKQTYAYHPSRFWSIFFHMTVHAQSAMLAIIIITLFPVPK
jgi:hypothetical protein